MPRTALKDLCLEIVAGSAQRFLDLQWSDGRFATEPERDTDEWNFYDQQYILAASLLYTSDHPANLWRGNERLWRAILSNGEHIVSRVGEDGSMRWRLRGVTLAHPFVCQRLTCAWLQAYRMLKKQLPQAEEAAWRETIVRACQWLVNRHLLPHREVVRFTSHDVGTGTNHFSLYLSLIWLAGQEFGRPEWTEMAGDLMRRLITDQRPGGYWEEHQGPAVGYNYLTYDGVGQYTIWSGDEAGLGALRRGLDLHKHWTYPDGIPVECIDGRMRHLSQPLMWGLAGFTRYPDGRGYARFLLERLKARASDLSGETVARVAEACLLLEDGDEITAPQEREAYRATLDAASVIRKESSWVVALSGQCSEPWPENQFCLDRQALVSVWRDGAGLVIDGSNSKFQPELATFRDASGDGAYMPLETKLVSVKEKDAVEYRYATFKARVAARIADKGAVELEFRVTEAKGGPVVMTLVPLVSYGESCLIEGRGELTLGDEKVTISEAGAVRYRGVMLRPPSGATIEYPMSPFNSYSADNTSPPSANRMVVRCAVGKGPVVWRVEAAE
jgi:hypothetical protein